MLVDWLLLKMNTRVFLTLPLMLFFCTKAIYSQKPTPSPTPQRPPAIPIMPIIDAVPYSTKVQVVAASEKSNVEVAGYFKRELRAIGDIYVVDEKAEWTLTINILPLHLANQQEPTGMTIAVTVTQPTDMLKDFVDYDDDLVRLTPVQKVKVRRWLDKLVTFKGTLLYVTNEKSLATTCRQIVANFDAVFLEPERKMWGKPSRQK
jgi:hypothetical protein